MRIGEIGDEQIQNLLIFGILIALQVSKFWKFFDFLIWEIPKISNL